MAPGLGHNRAAAHQDHHRAGIGGRHRQHQGLVARLQAQIGAITRGKVNPGAIGAQAGEPRQAPGQRAPQRTIQPLGGWHLTQHPEHIPQLDVLALMAPIEPQHQHGRVTAVGQGHGLSLVGPRVMVQLELGGRRP